MISFFLVDTFCFFLTEKKIQEAKLSDNGNLWKYSTEISRLYSGSIKRCDALNGVI